MLGCRRVVLVLGILLTPQFTAAQTESLGEVLRFRCEQLRQTGAFQIGRSDIASVMALPHFYEVREFKPAWTSAANQDDLLSAVKEAYRDGLDPEDYHFSELVRLVSMVRNGRSVQVDLAADVEMLLTDAFFRLIYHMEFGKVDPVRLDPSWNIHRDFADEDPALWLESALGSQSVFEFVESKKSKHHLYRCLKATLEKYRSIQDKGGWAPVPEGRSLKKGMHDGRITALRDRLSIAGDLPEGASVVSRDFDEELEKAVMSFQRRHGLEADGIVGARTREAMNVPVEQRIDQLRANLERGRWVLHDLSDTFILVNIAGFRVFYFKEGNIVWITRAQVGTPYRQTPVFKAEMDYVVFNPTWTVPPTILAKDLLPAIQEDAGYLAAKNMVVLDRGGKKVDPAAVEWSRYQGTDFPYVIRQEPGPENPLGRVKFIFPNEHFIFLHDTPRTSLFGKSERAFSSGCIRIEKPLDLAELLLDGRDGWNRARIDSVARGGKTQTVYLAKPVPTLLLYWTAFATVEGGCNFRIDVYHRDPAVIDALAGRPVIRKHSEEGREGVLDRGD
jgi:murein L,D-transpeptidase YcbB/YkuD